MRNRLLASVALCAVAVLAAGAPTVVAASEDATDSQQLIDLATLNQRAIALSHSLADERDDMVEYISAGRTSRGGAGVSEGQRARVDRQLREIQDQADVPDDVRKALKALPGVRQRAIAGRGGALDSYEAYSRTVGALRGVTREVAQGLPERAQDTTASALPDLARALDQASATRGLLRGALAGTGTRRPLASEAQRTRAREEAALADFEESAGGKARESFRTTVTGTDVNAAERYLARLTDRPYLTPADHALDGERVEGALSARIAHMRGVQSSLAAAEVKRLEGLRDDDVDALQIRAALVGVCLLLAVGISVSTARSLARPLSVLGRGSRRLAADPANEEPIVFHGRNDEFADVVRSLNALRESAAGLQDRAARAEAEQDQLAVAKAELTERYELLRRDYDSVREQLRLSADASRGTFVHLSLRTLGLVERQLGVIEGLEEKETDPDRLGSLFKLDHLATRMRRHTENLLLLAGAEHAGGHQQAPAPLLDVLRAAVSEIERYERVALGSVPPHTQIGGFAADDLGHLMAELLDNAASFSPPEAEVRLSGWMLESGEVALCVQDDGIGVDEDRLAELNARLGDPAAQEPPERDPGDGPNVLGMGLYVVARLAARHGLRVRVDTQQQGGLAAVVTVPRALLPDRPVPGAAAATGSGGMVPAQAPAALPGSVAEANSHDLPTRRSRRRRNAGADDWPLATTAGTDTGAGADTAAATATATAAVAEGSGSGSGEHTRTEDQAPAAVRMPEPEPEPKPEPEPEPGQAPAAGTEAESGTEGEAESGTEPGTASGTEPGTEAAPGSGATPPGGAAGPTTGGAGELRTAGVTAKGLPKRMPRTAGTGGAAAPRPRKGGAGAEELRRRLGGFQQGTKEGLRDAAAEVAAEENVEEQAGAQVDGGTAEEARK